MYPIEDNVPLPPSPKESPYPFKSLAVGDSFLVRDEAKWAAVRVAASKACKRLGKTFQTRKQLEGVRVWRTA